MEHTINSSWAEHFQARQKNSLYVQSLPVMSFNLVLGVLLVFIMWEPVPQHILFTWYLLLMAVVGIRAGMVLVHNHGYLQRLTPGHWLNTYMAGAFLTGSVWGMCVPLFGPFVTPLSLGTIALWPCGMAGGALATYALSRRVFFAYMIPALLPGAIYITGFGPEETTILGVALSVYLVFLSITALYSNRFQRRAIELEWENGRMARDLHIKNEAITRLNTDLEQRLRGSVAALEQEVRNRESNEQRLRLLVEHTPSSIAMLDQELRYLAVSKRWQEIYQLEDRELIGRHHYEIFPDIPERWRETHLSCLAGATERAYEDRFERADGTVDWLNWEVSPWYDDTGEIGGIVIMTELVTENIRAREQINRLTLYDTLTGLPNQYSLQQELERLCIQEKRGSLCLVLFEIRRFSEINSALGYEGADSLLKEIGNRMRQYVESSAYVARMGASVFAVIWPHVSTPEQALDRMVNLKNLVTAPVELEGAVFEPHLVAGAVLFPEHGRSPSILLRNATSARHAARQRREGYAFYDPAQDIPISSLVRLAELHRALDEKQFTLVYQPKLDLKNNHVCGAEALIRWQHPTQGLLPPSEFIPLAEESGFITPLTDWVIETAGRECARWHREGFSLGVSVNVYAGDIIEDEFLRSIKRFGEENIIPVESLTLEITESALMEDPQGSYEALVDIRNMGWNLALDDYGTGYASLAYLGRLPLNELKIDRGFIMNMEQDSASRRIVSSTISLGHELDLQITAEGIEHEQVKDQLTLMGCDVGQGFGISKPLPGEELLDFFRASPGAVLST